MLELPRDYNAAVDLVGRNADAYAHAGQRADRLDGRTICARARLPRRYEHRQCGRASRLRERVNLYLALGGDFEGTGAPK